MYHKWFKEASDNFLIATLITVVIVLCSMMPVQAASNTEEAHVDSSDTVQEFCPGNLIENPSFEETAVNALSGDITDIPLGWSGDAHNRNTSWITPPDGEKYGYTTSAMWRDIPVNAGGMYTATFYSATHSYSEKHQYVILQYIDESGATINWDIHTIDHVVDMDGKLAGPYMLKLGPAPTSASALRVLVKAETNWAKIDLLCLTEQHSTTDNETTEPYSDTCRVEVAHPEGTQAPVYTVTCMIAHESLVHVDVNWNSGYVTATRTTSEDNQLIAAAFPLPDFTEIKISIEPDSPQYESHTVVMHMSDVREIDDILSVNLPLLAR